MSNSLDATNSTSLQSNISAIDWNQEKDTKTGRFKPGNPGGPGRRKGIPNLKTIPKQRILKVMESECEEIISVVCAKAKQGDLTAAKLILNRVVPELTAANHKMQDELDQLKAEIESIARLSGRRH